MTVRVLEIGSLYPPQGRGGYENLWRDAVLRRRADGDAVRVLCSDHLEPGAEDEPEADDDVHRDLRWWVVDHDWPRQGLARRVRIEAANARALRRHVRELDPHAATVWAMGGMSLSLPAALRRRGLPVLSVCCDEWMGYAPDADGWTRMWQERPRLGRLVEGVSRWPTAFDPREIDWLFISQYLADRYTERFAIPTERIQVGRPGVELADFPEREEQPPWSWRLLYVGRFADAKGVDVAIDALAQLPGEATLTLLGGGDPAVERALREQAHRLGVADRVRWEPWQRPPELGRSYAAHDVLVFPVRWNEPWGLVPLEAMACGVPVIATGLGGSGEYLRDAENCLLFGRNDADGLAAAVRRLADDAGLRARLVDGGRRTAREHPVDALARGAQDWAADVAGRAARR